MECMITNIEEIWMIFFLTTRQAELFLTLKLKMLRKSEKMKKGAQKCTNQKGGVMYKLIIILILKMYKMLKIK